MQAVLNDVTTSLGATESAFFLVNEARELVRHALNPAAEGAAAASPPALVHRCLSTETSLLSRQDVVVSHPPLPLQKSGSAASTLCALVRTDREPLGVLYLTRTADRAPFTAQELAQADALAGQVAIGIATARALPQPDVVTSVVEMLVRALEIRDAGTGSHTHRVTAYAQLLAEEMGLSAEERRQVALGTALHDVGKLGIRDAVLNKPGTLTPAEWEHVRSHTIRGAALLEKLPGLQFLIPMVRSHHERWDGRGYPDRLAGEAIAPLARIVAVADAFDAMVSDRPYQAGMSVADALAEILDQSGSHFDPACVQAFLRLRPRLERLFAPQEPLEEWLAETV